MTKNKINWKKVKKVFSTIFLTLSILLFIMAAYIAVSSTVARSKGEQPSVFGMSFSVVITESMHGEIEVGELIIYNHNSISSVKEGDNIVFVATSGAISGQSVVHKAIDIGEDESGIYIQTKGVNNDLPDEEYVREGNFRGIVVMHSAFLGTIVSFFSNIVNLVIFVVVLGAFIVAISQVIKLVGYVVKKPEDIAEETDEELKQRLTAEILSETNTPNDTSLSEPTAPTEESELREPTAPTEPTDETEPIAPTEPTDETEHTEDSKAQAKLSEKDTEENK